MGLDKYGIRSKRSRSLYLASGLALFSALFFPSRHAHAALLGLVKTIPDIYSDTIDITYSSSTHVFTAIGFAENMDVNGVAPPTDYTLNGNFTLNMQLDAGNTGTLSSGTLVIDGDIFATGSFPPITNTAGPVLQGIVTQFGFASSSPFKEFEIVVGSLSGDAAFKFGSQVGIKLHAQSWGGGGVAFTGSFASSFHTQDQPADADLFPVPEPSSITLALIGLAGAGFLARRRNSRRSPRATPCRFNPFRKH